MSALEYLFQAWSALFRRERSALDIPICPDRASRRAMGVGNIQLRELDWKLRNAR